jgi:protein SCO1/2
MSRGPKLRLFAIVVVLLAAAASRAQEHSARDPGARMFPLTGVVVEVLADRQALLVKHDDIPGVMPPMTMRFYVEADVLARVKKGDAISAQTTRTREGRWILREVEVVPPAR